MLLDPAPEKPVENRFGVCLWGCQKKQATAQRPGQPRAAHPRNQSRQNPALLVRRLPMKPVVAQSSSARPSRTWWPHHPTSIAIQRMMATDLWLPRSPVKEL
jgi:hypothetical protein